MESLVLCLIPGKFVLCPRDLATGILDFRLVLLQLRLQLRNFQNGHDLSGLYVRRLGGSLLLQGLTCPAFTCVP